MITVVMAQFVTEMGLRWNLMAATAVMALVPAFLLALFGQKYVTGFCAFSIKNAKTKTGRRSYAKIGEMDRGGDRGIAGNGGWRCRTGERTADRLSAEPAAGRLGRDVRGLGCQERLQDRQGAEFLRRLRRRK